jgi:hypothetical protein
MKDNPASAFVKATLNVPQGLWELLDKMQTMTGEAPKDYLEAVLTKELECILGNLPNDMFDLKLIRTRYGEGSDISD